MARADGLSRLSLGLAARGYGDRIRLAEPLAGFTSFAIGGPADLLLVVRKLDEISELAQVARDCGVPYIVIGGGTNILVADAGVRGLVIVNRCSAFRFEASPGERCEETGLMLSESGARLADLARSAVRRGWAGLEWAVGVPGTLGGAVIGNAGAYGGCMADVVCWVEVMKPDGTNTQIEASALAYRYRTSALKQESWSTSRPVVLAAALQLRRSSQDDLARTVAGITRQRDERTPSGNCAGSMFKRTLQYPAGFLIDHVGLKGQRIGGAQVSPKHANFIMNTGGATATDVRRLINRVQDEVWAAFAQRLEPEIEFIGDWS